MTETASNYRHRSLPVLLVLLIAAGLGLASCRPSSDLIKPATLTADQIPAAVGDVHHAPAGATWHVLSQSADRLSFAYLYNAAVPYDRRFHIQVAHLSPLDGAPMVSWAVSGQIGEQTYAAATGSLIWRGSGGDPSTRIIYAAGVSLDRRVAVIKAVSAGGRTVQTAPVNGFWFVELDHDGTDTWAKVTAQDALGSVLHEFSEVRGEPRSRVVALRPAITVDDGAASHRLICDRVVLSSEAGLVTIRFPDVIEESEFLRALSITGARQHSVRYACSHPLAAERWTELQVEYAVPPGGSLHVAVPGMLVAVSGNQLGSTLAFSVAAASPGLPTVSIGGIVLAPGLQRVVAGPLAVGISFGRDMNRSEVERLLLLCTEGPVTSRPPAFSWTGADKVDISLVDVLQPFVIRLDRMPDVSGSLLPEADRWRYAIVPAEPFEVWEALIPEAGRPREYGFVFGPLLLEPWLASSSPDGRSVVFVDNLYGDEETWPYTALWIWSADTGLLRMVGRAHPGVAWLPDSSGFVAGPGYLTLYSREGKLLSQSDWTCLQYALSPDGKSIACVRDRVDADGRSVLDLVVCPSDLSAAGTRTYAAVMEPVVVDGAEFLQGPLVAWEGEAVQLWYDPQKTGGEVLGVSINLSDGVVSPLVAAPMPAAGAQRKLWRPDGSQFVIASDGGNGAVYDRNGRQVGEYTLGRTTWFLSWIGDDGKALLLVPSAVR